MAKKTTSKKAASIDVVEIKKGRIQFCVLGTTPIILRRMSQKALQELLMPAGRKGPAERKTTLKHDPFQEFRDSPYIDEENGPTLLAHLAVCFKKSIQGAALDIPGATKAQLGRTLWAVGERVPLYGIPQIFCAVTRNADMKRTPDVRTRVIVPQWACPVTFEFAKPILNETVIATLFAAAGMIQGQGDWRPEKGSGSYGQFKLVAEDDPEYQHLLKHAGRKEQEAAMESPEPYDRETRELLSWFSAEYKRRGFEVVK